MCQVITPEVLIACVQYQPSQEFFAMLDQCRSEILREKYPDLYANAIGQEPVHRLIRPNAEEQRAATEADGADRCVAAKVRDIYKGKATKHARCGQGGSTHQRKVEDNGQVRDRLARMYCHRHDCDFCFRGRKVRTLQRAAKRVLYLANSKTPRCSKVYAATIPTAEWKKLNRSIRRHHGDDCGRLRIDRTDDRTLVVCDKPFKGGVEMTPARAVDMVIASIDMLHPGKNTGFKIEAREKARSTFRLLGSWSDAKERKDWFVVGHIDECFDFEVVRKELGKMRKNPKYIEGLPGVRYMLEWRSESVGDANHAFEEMLDRCHLSGNYRRYCPQSDTSAPNGPAPSPEEGFSEDDTGQTEIF
jgi:hypothetical protein